MIQNSIDQAVLIIQMNARSYPGKETATDEYTKIISLFTWLGYLEMEISWFIHIITCVS